jgi:hypothetical protein
LDNENFHYADVTASIHVIFVCLVLKIISGGTAAPEAPIYSKAVIHFCLPLIFLDVVVSPLLMSTYEGKVAAGNL